MQLHKFVPCLLVAAVLAGCSGSSDAPKTEPSSTDRTTAAPAVKQTGKVIDIEMHSDEKGNYFLPATIEAHRGDMLRFTLKTGVHNIDFLPDSNPGKAGLPPAADMLQLPDQTWEYVVALAPGHYYFQCDPHAALGMHGKLEVEDEK
jgi:plastocyanin